MRMLLGHIVPTNHRPAKKRQRIESLDDQALIGPIGTKCRNNPTSWLVRKDVFLIKRKVIFSTTLAAIYSFLWMIMLWLERI